jgi:ParB-like chromosome segregation protein Spo0J
LTVLEIGCYDQSKGTQDIVQALERVEKSASRNGTACEKAATAEAQINLQLEALEDFSRQLGQLIEGISLKAAPASVGAAKEPPALKEEAGSPRQAPTRSKNEEPIEKTGTDGSKVIRLNNT